MPKDKLLRDVRYFEAPGEIFASFPSYAGKIFDVPKAAISLGQRIGCKCQELGISIGSTSHLYVALVPTFCMGQTMPLGYQAATWHKFVACGVPDNFNELPARYRLTIIEQITFAAIRACSGQVEEIQFVEDQVRFHGEKLEIVRTRKETRRYSIEVVFTVAPFGEPSLMWLKAKDKSDGRAVETDRLPLRFYDDVFDLADRLSVKNDGKVLIQPRTSFRAKFTLQNYQVPMTYDLAVLMDQRRAASVHSSGR